MIFVHQTISKNMIQVIPMGDTIAERTIFIDHRIKLKLPIIWYSNPYSTTQIISGHFSAIVYKISIIVKLHKIYIL